MGRREEGGRQSCLCTSGSHSRPWELPRLLFSSPHQPTFWGWC